MEILEVVVLAPGKVWEVAVEVTAGVLELEEPGKGAWVVAPVEVVEDMMAVGVLVVLVMVEAGVEAAAHKLAALVMVPVVLVWDQEDGGLVADAEDQMEHRQVVAASGKGRGKVLVVWV